MTTTSIPTWHRVKQDLFHKMEVLASSDQLARDHCIAVVENFGYGWYANALPPHVDGTSSAVPGMIRGGAYGDNVEAAKAWCERICGVHAEKVGDRHFEPTTQASEHSAVVVHPSTRDGQIANTLVADPSRSDRDIARALSCSPTSVGKVRAAMGLSAIERSVHRAGQMYSMRASGKGTSR